MLCKFSLNAVCVDGVRNGVETEVDGVENEFEIGTSNKVEVGVGNEVEVGVGNEVEVGVGNEVEVGYDDEVLDINLNEQSE